MVEVQSAPLRVQKAVRWVCAWDYFPLDDVDMSVDTARTSACAKSERAPFTVATCNRFLWSRLADWHDLCAIFLHDLGCVDN